jgi:hypothetical protein
MNNDFDLEKLRVSNLPMTVPPSPHPPRHQPGQAFLKGPIPWIWLVQAGQLPGQALAVGLVLWREAGCKNCRTISFRLSLARQFGMHPDTARRALHALEQAGLIATRCIPGRHLEVTLLAASLSQNPDTMNDLNQ